MIICNSNNHVSIVFGIDIDCPLCQAVKEIEDLKKELRRLKEFKLKI